MKYDILNIPCKKYKDNMIIWLIGVIGILVITIVLNVCLSVFRTDTTHTAFLAVNIITDIIAVWAIITIACEILIPRYRIYKLYVQIDDNGEKVSGQLIEKSDTQKFEKIDCVVLSIETDEGIRRVFAPQNTFCDNIEIGNGLNLTLVNNIACCCEVCDEA